jgi:transmembrane 9 superfamily protein 1
MKHLQNNSLVPKSLEIHWLSIVNSSVLVILLTFLLLIIFNRILKNDLSNYMDLELNEDVMEEEEVSVELTDIVRTFLYICHFTSLIKFHFYSSIDGVENDFWRRVPFP